MKALGILMLGAGLSGSAGAQMFSEGFDGGAWPPPGWMVIDNASSSMVWDTTASFARGNVVPDGSGEAASIDAAFYGASGDRDSELWTTPFEVPTGGTWLTWEMDYQNFPDMDLAEVDLSLDGGASWINLATYNQDQMGNFRVDLSAYGGSTGAIVRFHYYETSPPHVGEYWQVDNVRLLREPSATTRNGGTNHNVFTITGEPYLGTTITAEIDCGGLAHDYALLLGYDSPLSFNLGLSKLVLVDFTGPELLALTALPASPVATYALPIPNLTALVGYTVFLQAAVFTLSAPPVSWELTNAQDLVLAPLGPFGGHWGLAEGLVAYYDLDDTGSVTRNDVGPDATYLGSTNGAPGIIGTAYWFSMSNTYIVDTQTDIGSTTSFSFWMGDNGWPGPDIFGTLESGANGYHARIAYGNLEFYYLLNNQYVNIIMADLTPYMIPFWTHVVITVDESNTTRIYANGSELVPLAYVWNTVPAVHDRTLILGHFMDDPMGGLNARLDEVGVWNRALDAVEVDLLYNGGAGLTY